MKSTFPEPHGNGRRHPDQSGLGHASVASACLLCVSLSCGVDPMLAPPDPVPNYEIDSTTFPEGFMWGAAGSAHQNEGNDTDSDWWYWETAGRTVSGDVSGAAADFYNRYEQDF